MDYKEGMTCGECLKYAFCPVADHNIHHKACMKITTEENAEPREKRISELDKENGKLEGKLADLQSEYIELENFKNNEVNALKAQLTKAKELLAFWVDNFNDSFNRTIKYEERHKALVETEQFLKEASE